MLDCLIRNGARRTLATTGMCWQCVLERQLAYRPFHNTISRPSNQNSSTTDPKPPHEPKNTQETDAGKKSAKQKAPKTSKVLTQELSPSTTSNNDGESIKKKSDPTSETPLIVKKSKSRGKNDRSKRARLRRRKLSKEIDTSRTTDEKRVEGSKNLFRRQLSKDKTDGGRSRLQRHYARAQREATVASADEASTEKSTVESAMRGASLEKGRKNKDSQMEDFVHFMANELAIEVVNKEVGRVPRLAHGLQRVLFNRGVYQLRDLHTRVYNFDPSIEILPPADKVDFKSLTQFTPPSKDATLAGIAQESGKKFIGSTSSLTGMLKHFHFLLSAHRGVNFSMLSTLNKNSWSFSKITKSPDAVFLKYRDGLYSVDADKQYDKPNVLSLMGRFLEKYFTSDTETFDKFKVGNTHLITKDDIEADAFHYSTIDDFLMRSQLDAYDPRLPGTGIFDLKTRAVLPIRMDNENFVWGMDYELNQGEGEHHSFEREYADMARATMLKYSLQARIGRMDGIFVAYHNIQRVFGFQYISINEMDYLLHGQEDRCLGDQEFLASMHLLNKLVNHAIEKYPKQSLRIHVEAPDVTHDKALYFFAEPVTEDEINEIQTSTKGSTEAWENEILGLSEDENEANVAPSVADTEPAPGATTDTARFRARAQRIHEKRVAYNKGSTAEEKTHFPTWVGAKQPTSPSTSDRTSEREATASLEESPIKEPGPPATTNAVPDGADQTRPSPSLSTSTPPDPAPDASATASSSEAAMPETTESDNRSSQDPSSTEMPATSSLSPTDKKAKPRTKPGPKEDPPAEDRPLIALKLAVRSTINGRPHPRPKDLKPTDEWRVSHSITEITPDTKAWRMYESMTRRRKALMTKDKQKQAGEKDFFRDQLVNATEKAKQWRQGREEEDKKKEEEQGGVWVWDSEEVVQRKRWD